jgi:hypothetical protein
MEEHKQGPIPKLENGNDTEDDYVNEGLVAMSVSLGASHIAVIVDLNEGSHPAPLVSPDSNEDDYTFIDPKALRQRIAPSRHGIAHSKSMSSVVDDETEQTQHPSKRSNVLVSNHSMVNLARKSCVSLYDSDTELEDDYVNEGLVEKSISISPLHAATVSKASPGRETRNPNQVAEDYFTFVDPKSLSQSTGTRMHGIAHSKSISNIVEAADEANHHSKLPSSRSMVNIIEKNEIYSYISPVVEWALGQAPNFPDPSNSDIDGEDVYF